MKVIYVDVLFLFNFVVDHLLLDLTSYLRGGSFWRHSSAVLRRYCFS